MKQAIQKAKMKRYLVTMDVFFMESHEVEARNKKEAFEEAKNKVCHGLGEEVTLFNVEEVK